MIYPISKTMFYLLEGDYSSKSAPSSVGRARFLAAPRGGSRLLGFGFPDFRLPLVVPTPQKYVK